MGYVALSSVKNLNNLYLMGINQMALRVSEDAQTIDGVLRDKAANDAKRFAHLQKIAEERAANPVVEKTTDKKGWNEKIAKMRETYPNAYKPWEESQDAELKQAFQQGSSLEELSTLLGRHEGSIKMRLQKHFGEDAVQG